MYRNKKRPRIFEDELLPDVVFEKIISYLSGPDLLVARQAAKRFETFAKAELERRTSKAAEIDWRVAFLRVNSRFPTFALARFSKVSDFKCRFAPLYNIAPDSRLFTNENEIICVQAGTVQTLRDMTVSNRLRRLTGENFKSKFILLPFEKLCSTDPVITTKTDYELRTTDVSFWDFRWDKEDKATYNFDICPLNINEIFVHTSGSFFMVEYKAVYMRKYLFLLRERVDDGLVTHALPSCRSYLSDDDHKLERVEALRCRWLIKVAKSRQYLVGQYKRARHVSNFFLIFKNIRSPSFIRRITPRSHQLNRQSDPTLEVVDDSILLFVPLADCLHVFDLETGTFLHHVNTRFATVIGRWIVPAKIGPQDADVELTTFKFDANCENAFVVQKRHIEPCLDKGCNRIRNITDSQIHWTSVGGEKNIVHDFLAIKP